MTHRASPFHYNSFISKAWWVLYINRVWPRLIWIMLAAFGLVSFILFDFWRMIPHGLAVPLIYSLMAGFILALALALCWRLPKRKTIEQWLKDDVGLDHQPLSTLNDKPANYILDNHTRELWDRHQKQIQERLGTVKHPRFQSLFYKSDRFALRTPIMLILVIALLGSDNTLFTRLTEAINPNTSGNVLQPDITVWVEAPEYLDQPDINLISSSDSGTLRGNTLNVIEGSQLVVFGEHQSIQVRLNGQKLTANLTNKAENHRYARINLNESGGLIIASPGYDVDALKPPLGVWSLNVKKDEPPSIDFVDEPRADQNGELLFSYTTEDDHGISDIRSIFTLVNPDDIFSDPLISAPDPLFNIPEGKQSFEEVALSLLRHPWAGLEVDMQLIAKDHRGNEGLSEIKRFVLPEIGFIKTLARAIIEQRYHLSQSLSLRHQVLERIKLLTLWPDRINDPTAFTALKVAQTRIHNANQKLRRASYYAQILGQESNQAKEQVELAHKGLSSTLDWLFEVALTVDGQTLESAREAMNQAFRDLEKALNRNAGDDEVRAHIEHLRETVARYLQALTITEPGSSPPAGGETISRSFDELEEAMRVLGQLNKLNERDAARAVLKQLQSIIDGIETIVVQENQPDPEREALDDLGKLLGDLRELNDKIEDEANGNTESDDQNQSEANPQGEPQPESRQEGQNQQQGQDQGSDQGDATNQNNPDTNQKDDTSEQAGKGTQALEPSIRKLLREQDKLNETLNNFIEQLDQKGLLSNGDTNQSEEADSGTDQNNSTTEPSQEGGANTAQEQNQEQGQAHNLENDGHSGQEAANRLRGALNETLEALKNADSGKALAAQEEAIEALRSLSESLSQKRDDRDQAQQGEEQANPFGASNGRLSLEGTELPPEAFQERLSDLLKQLRNHLEDKTNTPEFRDYLERLIQ